MDGRFTVPLPAKIARACVVCAEAIDWRLPLTSRRRAAEAAPELYPLCLDPDCRWLFRTTENLPFAEFQRQVRWRGRAWRQDRARVEEARERARERTEAQDVEDQAAFAALGHAGLDAPPDLQLVVPSGPKRLRPLSERRRRAHIAHLDTIIAAALVPLDQDLSARPMVPLSDSESVADGSSLPGQLCGACAGGCCATAKEGAFLREETIRRVLADHPGLDPAALRELYLSHIEPRTSEGGCIYQTRGGCNLPRSLRSDTCNSFVCGPLRLLLEGLIQDPPARTAVVLRRRQNTMKGYDPTQNNAIVGAAVLTETGTRRIVAPTPEVGPVDRPRVTGER